MHAVAAFVEKPDAATAANYIADGYLWNSGNFMFRADVLLDEYSRASSRPALQAVQAAVDSAGTDLGFVTLDRDAFGRAPPNSIDYAVMEKTDRAAVVPASFGWSDVGSWDAVWEVADTDDARQCRAGARVFEDSRNCIVTPTRRWWPCSGSTISSWWRPRTRCWCSREQTPTEVKRLVAKLKAESAAGDRDHRRVLSAVGLLRVDRQRRAVSRSSASSSSRADSCRCRSIIHRAEHWVVVRGTAEVTIDDSVRTVHENESIYIPIGAVHRLANPGKIPLELIEVQTGSYLGEDDIIRLEDVYRRD